VVRPRIRDLKDENTKIGKNSVFSRKSVMRSLKA